MNTVEEAIIKTLCYGDVFDYPMNMEELHKYLITKRAISLERLLPRLEKLVQNKIIGTKNNYFFLNDREGLVELRAKRVGWSTKKITYANDIVPKLSEIEGVVGIFLTGAVAMKNADDKDDIDLMIVTKSNNLWRTRFKVLRLLQKLGVRRRPNDSQVKNLICSNFFVDETALEIPEKKRGLYSAHEVIQVKKIWDKNESFKTFVQLNDWVKEYLGNSMEKGPNLRSKKSTDSSQASVGEYLAYWLQYAYMKPKMTNETIGKNIAMFHPNNTGEKVMDEYMKRVNKLADV